MVCVREVLLMNTVKDMQIATMASTVIHTVAEFLPKQKEMNESLTKNEKEVMAVLGHVENIYHLKPMNKSYLNIID
eukprot:CAMPEP_0205811446 /NCGR_PEP_ID=MMETSP0205-20121125/15635_1 /ASSEMBLY_ACC=CAM_ASM_000278 /TAXON_ID=36767 /ORGANISM="Euplotes focardii, Strain TN1" /LENGTH=75 /DNA_ID=CAMNT_0053090603 /DNA_START=285 /DNA_END=512 /DNA_ORIENTATION=-